RLIVRAEDMLAPKGQKISGIKGLLVDYEYAGHRSNARAMQQRIMELPVAADVEFAPQPFELNVVNDDVIVRGWDNGTATFQTSSGKTIRTEIHDIAQPE